MHGRSDIGGWSVGEIEMERAEVTGGSVIVHCSSSHLTAFASLVDVKGNRVGGYLLELLICRNLYSIYITKV